MRRSIVRVLYLAACLAAGSGLSHGAVRVLPLDPSVPFFGAKFEPHGIYHLAQGETRSFVVWDCSSQPTTPCSSFGTIDKYALATGEDPIGVMQYITKDDWHPSSPGGFGQLGIDIKNTIEQKLHIAQIGMGFWPSGETHFDDTAAAANGAYDGFWKDLAKLIKSSKEPVFIRPGYEFGGTGAGSFYNPVTYRAAFQRIVNIFRGQGAKNVAFVWDQYNAQNYMDFYPGDAYVDWWGINLFHNGDFTSATTASFMDDALAHNKPVIICESSPKDQPVTDPNAWSLWYGPYFDFILKYHSHVKAFSYINSSWSGFSGFQESRIEMDPTVVQPMYASMVADPIILHHLDDAGLGVLYGPSISILPGEGIAAVGVGTTSATITWKTTGPKKKQKGKTTSQVEYGTTTAYGALTTENTKLQKKHSVTLTGLTPAATYHFRVHGFDKYGFEIRSGDFTFTTAP